MDRKQLRNWLYEYEEAWRTHDADYAGSLFTEDAQYHQNPFEVFEGREEIVDYWDRVTPKHEDITVVTQILGLDGERGFIRFYAEYTNPEEVNDDHPNPENVRIKLDGIGIVHLRDGKCFVFREWWHRQP